MKRFALLFFSFLVFPLFGQDIIINEIHHTPASDALEFVELYNRGTEAVDLSHWAFDKGIDFKFVENTFLEAESYLLIAKNPNALQKAYKLAPNCQILGPFKGRLDGSGEYLKLKDHKKNTVDAVYYKNEYPWAISKKATKRIKAESIQLVHPQFDNRIGAHWAAEQASPGAANHRVYSELNIPIVKSIRHYPQSPTSNTWVTVRANVRNADQVELHYQIVEPGAYIALSDSNYHKNWHILQMSDNGKQGDKVAADRVFTVQIPAKIQQHRHLVRYKIIAKGDTSFQAPRTCDPQPNFAYYTYDQLPDYQGHNLETLTELPVCQLLAKAADVQHLMFEYEKRDYKATGTVVYNGRVYDHIGFRSRGFKNRHSRQKRNLKFNFHKNHPIEVVNDFGESYATKRDKLVLSGGWLLDQPNLHGLGESVMYRLFTLQNSSACYADYLHLRVVQHAEEADSSKGDFWGLYLMLENFDGDFLKTHDLPNANVYSYKPFKARHQSNKDMAQQQAIYTNWDTSYTQSHPESWWKEQLDWDNYLGFLIGNELAGNRETGYRKQHWWTEYHHPKKGWQFFPWDLDKTWSSSRGKSTISYSIFTKAFEHPALEKAYKNELRSVLDLLYNEEQAYQLIDEEARLIYNKDAAYSFADLDKLRWGHDYDGDFGTQINYLKGFVRKRRTYILKKQLNDKIPAQPTLSYTGEANYPTEALSFNCNSVDSQSVALQWRIGEVSDPKNSYYDHKKAKFYEITTLWEQTDSSLQANIRIPKGICKPGHSYRIRVRMSDTSGYFSHWSDPVQFIPSAPVQPTGESLVINELLFNPTERLEFIELYNNSAEAISLEGFAFQKGIRYTFPANAQIEAYGFLVLTNDQALFEAQYGFQAQAVYAGKLSKNGEALVLTNSYDKIVDSLSYSTQWLNNESGQGISLELIKSDRDNALAANWQLSYALMGTPGAINSSFLSTAIQEEWNLALYLLLFFTMVCFIKLGISRKFRIL